MWKGFQKPKRLAAELESLTDKYGKFSAQPFERGWGTTVGNAIRRALLSSIEGAAITAVKIEGVLHEFSPIPGVVEDATDIILNLKAVPLKLNSDQSKTITLNVDAPGPVTSARIEEDADIAVLDKNVYIATVSEGGKLELEMRVKNGRGYVSADRNFDEDLPIGYIPIDSVHSPVRKVNYAVEAARLGQMTDYEKLSLEVWTNGAITPQDAIGLASKLVKDHMSIFINFEESPDLPEEVVENYNDPRLDHLDRSVEELELSVRSYNCLKNANIQSLRELVQKTESEMLKTKNFGRKSLNEIKEILQKMGLEPGHEVRRSRPDHLAAAAEPDCASASGGNRRLVVRGTPTMRHLKSGFKLGKNPAHRRAVLRNLVTNLIENERITHYDPARESGSAAGRTMITLGKRDTLHARRQAAAFLQTPGATKKLFADLAPRFADRPGGYTRIIRRAGGLAMGPNWRFWNSSGRS